MTSAAAVLFASLPNIWAYPGTHVMADMVISLVILIQLALGLSIAAVVRLGVKIMQENQRRGNEDADLPKGVSG